LWVSDIPFLLHQYYKNIWNKNFNYILSIMEFKVALGRITEKVVAVSGKYYA